VEVRNALNHYVSFGFHPPAKRVKSVGIDYAQGGYFKFHQHREAQRDGHRDTKGA
jgi:asparagine synthase (glutamine-hydrolysing)